MRDLLDIVNTYIYWIKNYIIILWSKTILFFGYEYDKTKIPSGLYCYEPDLVKNKNRKDFSAYYIIPCPYYLTLGKYTNGCKFYGVITDDIIFNDQCKICDINYDISDDEK